MAPTTFDLLRSCLALCFVLGLIWLLGYLARRYGWRLGLPAPMALSRVRRLQMLEILPLDPRSKLVLVRQDATEHLLLIGNQSTQVVHSQPAAEPLAPKDAA